jgi:hypothetical protein
LKKKTKEKKEVSEKVCEIVEIEKGSGNSKSTNHLLNNACPISSRVLFML